MAVLEGKENHASPARGEIHDNEGYEGKSKLIFLTITLNSLWLIMFLVLVTNVFLHTFSFSLMHLQNTNKNLILKTKLSNPTKNSKRTL